MKHFLTIALVVVFAGCGHSQMRHNPAPAPGMTWAKATAIIERGFYEDYGDQKTQSVHVTEEAIILADGSITTGSHYGTAIPTYGSAIVTGNSTAKTVAAGQRIYLDSLQPSLVMKRNGRDSRYAVVIRTEPGITARRIYFRSEARAKEFADAIEYVRRSHEISRTE
jgi:hypothetical protein